MTTKSQELMVEDGAPKAIVELTAEQRAQAWLNSPPKPMPAFTAPKSEDQATLQLLAEAEFKKKNKASNRIHKMLEKKVDRTGQRWDGRKGKWVKDDIQEKVEQAMISITTNTRGATKMPAQKDYAEMTGPELVEAYNKISGKDPIKKFKDRATGLARMAELMTQKAKAKAEREAAAKANGKANKPKEPKAASENKRAAEFGCRVGSFREKLIIALDESYRKMVGTGDLLKAVYGSKNTENTGALTMVLKGAQIMIEKNKLPYELKKEKGETEMSYGLYPKS